MQTATEPGEHGVGRGRADDGLIGGREVEAARLATSGAGILAATGLNTALDVGRGFADLPSAIGHLGEGSGNFAGAPSLKTAPGLVGDVLTAASVVAPVGGVLRGGAAAADRLNLYRVVEPGEVTDILTTGRLNPSSSGGAVKYFWGAFSDAERYASLIEGKTGFGSPLSIIRTSADRSVVSGPYTMDTMDAYTVLNEHLSLLAPPSIMR